MKKTLISSMLGAAALFSVATPAYSQGKINLNNYVNTGNRITYGSDWGGANWGPAYYGAGLQNGIGAATWSIGFYYALGDVTSSVAADPTTFADPSTLGGGLALATGAAGDTTTIKNIGGGGYFTTSSDAIVNGWTAGPITIEVVAYNGSSYDTSFLRSHSAAFLLTPVASTAPQAAPTTSPPPPGSGMPAFSINTVPEPTAFALAGIGAALFLAFRRKRNLVNQKAPVGH